MESSLKTIRVKANSIGVVLAGTLADTAIRCDWTKTARGVIVNNGLDNKMIGVRGSGGYLCQVRNCKSLMWSSGGSDSRTHQYGAYIGDVLAGDYARKVDLISLRFTYAENQAIVRVMGGDVTITGGRYDQSGNTGNEALQLRHGRFVVRDATIIGSIVAGPLEPGQASQAAIAAYHMHNWKFPAWTHLLNCTLTGHVRAVGKTPMLVEGGTTVAPDPRGGSPSRCFNTTTFKSFHGTHAPTLIVMNHAVNGFKEFAASTVIIGPGCYLNGKKQATRGWTNTAQKLAAQIREEAAKR